MAFRAHSSLFVTSIPPPPVVGEQLGLAIDPKVRDAKPVPKARRSKPGPAKGKPYDAPTAEVRAVAEKGSVPPPSRRGRGN